MDTFFEQIVPVKRTAKENMLLVDLWVVAAALVYLIVSFLFGTALTGIALMLAIGIAWGAYKLSTLFSKEYEYIITNGTLDVDKITAKSSRKRELSCELSATQSLERYKGALPTGDFKKIVKAANTDDANAYVLVVYEEGKGKRVLLFSPDERMKGAIKKFLPKFLANSAFKD